MPEITDRKSLAAWLETQPSEVSVAIAARAALRVLPIIHRGPLTGANGTGKTALTSCFRAISIASVLAIKPNVLSILTQSVRSATYSAAEASANTREAANAAVGAVRSALSAAGLRQSTSRSYSEAVSAVAVSASAAGAVAISKSGSRDLRAHHKAVWHAVQQDVDEISNVLLVVERPEEIVSGAVSMVMASPLWPELNPLEEEWEQLCTHLNVINEGWRVWINWYDNILQGRHWPEEVAFKVATISDEDWEQGPAHVNGMIAGLLEHHQASSDLSNSPPTPIPEQNPHGAIWDLRDGKFGIVASSEEIGDQASVLQPLALEALRELIVEVRNSNQFAKLAEKAQKTLEIAEQPLHDVNVDSAELWALSLWLGSFAERDDHVRSNDRSFSEALNEDQRMTLDFAIRQTAAFTRQFRTALVLDTEDASFRRLSIDVASHREVIVLAHRAELIEDAVFEAVGTLAEAAAGPAVQGEKAGIGVVFTTRNFLIGVALSCAVGAGGLAYNSLDQLREIATKGFARGARVEERFEKFGRDAAPAIDRVLQSSPPDLKNSLGPLLAPNPPPKP